MLTIRVTANNSYSSTRWDGVVSTSYGRNYAPSGNQNSCGQVLTNTRGPICSNANAEVRVFSITVPG